MRPFVRVPPSASIAHNGCVSDSVRAPSSKRRQTPPSSIGWDRGFISQSIHVGRGDSGRIIAYSETIVAASRPRPEVTPIRNRPRCKQTLLSTAAIPCAAFCVMAAWA